MVHYITNSISNQRRGDWLCSWTWAGKKPKTQNQGKFVREKMKKLLIERRYSPEKRIYTSKSINQEKAYFGFGYITLNNILEQKNNIFVCLHLFIVEKINGEDGPSYDYISCIKPTIGKFIYINNNSNNNNTKEIAKDIWVSLQLTQNN